MGFEISFPNYSRFPTDRTYPKATALFHWVPQTFQSCSHYETITGDRVYKVTNQQRQKFSHRRRYLAAYCLVEGLGHCSFIAFLFTTLPNARRPPLPMWEATRHYSQLLSSLFCLSALGYPQQLKGGCLFCRDSASLTSFSCDLTSLLLILN